MDDIEVARAPDDDDEQLAAIAEKRLEKQLSGCSAELQAPLEAEGDGE